MKEYKLIIAGGRDFSNYKYMKDTFINVVEELPYDRAVSIVSGMARGADALAVRLAKQLNVKLYEFPADWNTYGKSAGFIRNTQMGNFADGALIFWDGESKGTKHMISTMKKLGKDVIVFMYDNTSKA